MKILRYTIRLLLALTFAYASMDKFLNPIVPEVPDGVDPAFGQFYELLLTTGYLFFVSCCQLLCAILIMFKRTYLLGAVMFVPLLLCLLMTHVFISQDVSYMLFDGFLFALNAVLIAHHYPALKTLLLKPQQRWI